MVLMHPSASCPLSIFFLYFLFKHALYSSLQRPHTPKPCHCSREQVHSLCVCVCISRRLLGSGLCWRAGGWLLRHLLHQWAWVNIKDAPGDCDTPGTYTNKTQMHDSLQTHMLCVYLCKRVLTHRQIQTPFKHITHLKIKWEGEIYIAYPWFGGFQQWLLIKIPQYRVYSVMVVKPTFQGGRKCEGSRATKLLSLLSILTSLWSVSAGLLQPDPVQGTGPALEERCGRSWQSDRAGCILESEGEAGSSSSGPAPTDLKVSCIKCPGQKSPARAR